MTVYSQALQWQESFGMFCHVMTGCPGPTIHFSMWAIQQSCILSSRLFIVLNQTSQMYLRVHLECVVATGADGRCVVVGEHAAA